MRPKKTRWVRCEPGERCFQPKHQKGSLLEGIILTLDEFEAIRLAYLEGLDQEKVAQQMKVHRSTISRIIASANSKIADALVNIKAIKIEGGCCEIVRPRTNSRSARGVE